MPFPIKRTRNPDCSFIIGGFPISRSGVLSPKSIIRRMNAIVFLFGIPILHSAIVAHKNNQGVFIQIFLFQFLEQQTNAVVRCGSSRRQNLSGNCFYGINVRFFPLLLFLQREMRRTISKLYKEFFLCISLFQNPLYGFFGD